MISETIPGNFTAFRLFFCYSPSSYLTCNEIQALKTLVCFWKGYMQTQARSQDSSIQLELVKQLIVTIHLNSATAELGQT